ncbi:hypothetical protein KY289_022103 [Solanum tuberosum]|nr:hypothetical protein KY284_022000 [Solanum tuberosum]KAH0684351.1 hypothetical protein KY289_022103 [Solanum tuberosum]
MQEPNMQHGVWKHQCIICNQLFSSSQAIAGHTKIHYKDVIDTDSPNSHQLGSSSPVLAPPNTDSPNSHQLGSSSPVLSPPDTDSPNSHQLGSSSPVLAPPDTDSPNSHQLGSSSLVVAPPKQNLRLRDMKTLARLKGRLTKEEERVLLLLLDNAKK